VRLPRIGHVRTHEPTSELQRQLDAGGHDAALAEIHRQLAYKTARRGGTLIQAPTFYPSSKACSACGAAKAKLPLSERTFRCQERGFVLDRDENAARNLASLAHSTVAGTGSET
jgi:putative transposase